MLFFFFGIYVFIISLCIFSRRLLEADSEAAVEVGDKGVDIVEGEALTHHPAMDIKFLFLKLPLEWERQEKMRFLLAKAVKYIPANRKFFLHFVIFFIVEGRFYL